MGQLSQRNSVHRVRILIFFVYLAKRKNPEVRLSEDKKANVTVPWGSTLRIYKMLPIRFCEKAGIGRAKRLKSCGVGEGMHTTAAEVKLKSRPGSRSVLCPQAPQWQKAERRALEARPAFTEHSSGQQEVSQLSPPSGCLTGDNDLNVSLWPWQWIPGC